MFGLNCRIVLSRFRTVVLFVVAWVAGAGLAVAGATPSVQLRYVVIITRHGVRSPTWNSERLNQYSAEPWPKWSVPPGNLTPHGRALMQLMGAYYREWLSGERLLSPQGCGDVSRVYIYADTEQRTLETGRALAETLLPGCAVAVHSQPPGSRDSLFHPLEAGITKPDWEIAAQAVRKRLADPSGRFRDLHRAAFETLEFVLAGGGSAPEKRIEPPDEISVSVTGTGIRLNEPWSVASSLSENLGLEYAEGMHGKDLGWGRLDANSLFRVLELHAVYADLMRRTPYVARARGSNLLFHILRSMDQAATGNSVPGALDRSGDAVLIVSGHDTNLSNLSGMLGLSWHLPGYQPDDTPPGGALVFSLWRDPRGEYFVKTQYLAQTPDQMRNGDRLTVAAPPASEELPIPGCGAASQFGCAWRSFRRAIQEAIDPAFTTLGAEPQSPIVQRPLDGGDCHMEWKAGVQYNIVISCFLSNHFARFVGVPLGVSLERASPAPTTCWVAANKSLYYL
jgi:4-phytase/acid phosphatase